MNLWLSILLLIIWVIVHSTISKRYYWKSSIVSLVAYILFVFSFFEMFPFAVMFVVCIIYFALLTISAFLQRNSFVAQGK